MITHQVDIACIGAGPAGLAAAIEAKKNGAKTVLVLDRNQWLGGILPQCIHDGFGVEETGQSMTGPEYAEMYIKQAQQENIELLTETMALSLTKKREIFAVNKEGLHHIKAKAVILAMGCREKTRWSIPIPGDRPSGIYTAGMVQSFINLYNIMPGKNIIILGSGDVGLIIARRLTLEGANVLGVIEILPHPTGLPRNIVQCLDDYDNPLYLNHTITEIKGKHRLQEVTIAQVDKTNQPIEKTKRVIPCDTLILSLGLIPENELSIQADIQIDPHTGGAIVDQDFHTTIPGIFACGNGLQVYDTVDMLSIDAKKTGKNAAEYIQKSSQKNHRITTTTTNNIRSITPQQITNYGPLRFLIRAQKPQRQGQLTISSKSTTLLEKKVRYINPATMIDITFELSKREYQRTETIEVNIQ